MPLGAQLQIGDSRLKDLSLLQPSEELEEVDDIIEHQLQRRQRSRHPNILVDDVCSC